MPQFPKNNLAQHIIASLVANNVEDIVISPGSRNAPLTIGFNNHPSFTCYSIVDERSAAFFALGIAQQKRKPVVVVCTSGSALLNYYPAIAEAYYSDIPLIVLSADRPKKFIDIGDGQTIRQEHVFDRHILASLNLEEEVGNSTISDIMKIIDEAKRGKGPVHINAPFDEPLYEVTDGLVSLNKTNEVVPRNELENLSSFAKKWNKATKKMILVGECFPNIQLQYALEKFLDDPSVLILCENTANVSHPNFINSIDKLIFPFIEDELEQFQPEILLSLGGMIVSKKIKQHLRTYQPRSHWHVDSKKAFDTFLCLEHHFKADPISFFEEFIPLTEHRESQYQGFWMQKKKKRLERHEQYLKTCDFSDLKVFKILLKSLPENIQLQLSNSSVIRYTQLFDIKQSVQIFCNRGTSGIDGSTSTAIGAAVSVDRQTVFISGDISFFYDSNALWNSAIPNNFRIIVINNGGGAIFRFIPGPKGSNALDYFETPHNLNTVHLCKMHDIEYFGASDERSLEEVLTNGFYDASAKPRLLEIKTPQLLNDEILKSYFKNLR